MSGRDGGANGTEVYIPDKCSKSVFSISLNMCLPKEIFSAATSLSIMLAWWRKLRSVCIPARLTMIEII